MGKSKGLGAGLVGRSSNRDAYRRLSIRKKQTYSENDIVHECLADEKRRPSSAHLALDDVIAGMLMSAPNGGKVEGNFSAQELDTIMKNHENKFIKVRDKWRKERAMILSADRLNILISSKGVNLKKTKVISVEEISEVTLGMQDKSVWGSKNSASEENC